mmetsp:Transcript_64532/g.209501  ORF Transcript_64532/g.209501 Transcript_64532/m.209501 type:complete len:270 (+) Transcript_64532:127-936(+)
MLASTLLLPSVAQPLLQSRLRSRRLGACHGGALRMRCCVESSSCEVGSLAVWLEGGARGLVAGAEGGRGGQAARQRPPARQERSRHPRPRRFRGGLAAASAAAAAGAAAASASAAGRDALQHCDEHLQAGGKLGGLLSAVVADAAALGRLAHGRELQCRHRCLCGGVGMGEWLGGAGFNADRSHRAGYRQLWRRSWRLRENGALGPGSFSVVRPPPPACASRSHHDQCRPECLFEGWEVGVQFGIACRCLPRAHAASGCCDLWRGHQRL